MKSLLTALLVLVASTASAQADRTVVVVTDVKGNPIPHAMVQIESGVPRIADDSGRVTFNSPMKDSLRVQVRRMGFNPYIGWVRRKPDATVFVTDLIPLPRALDAVTIAGRRDTPLARTGFYDRVARVQRGAYSARMITPEELDLRNPLTVSQMLAGDRFVKVQPVNGKNVFLSRNPNCAMTILLDGQRAVGTLEEGVGLHPNKPPISSLMSVDELVSAGSLAAIEVYGSMASAPAELQRAAGNSGGCGLVALWTGSRR